MVNGEFVYDLISSARAKEKVKRAKFREWSKMNLFTI